MRYQTPHPGSSGRGAPLDYLKTDKSDQLSKTDSDEYTDMKKSIAAVRKPLQDMMGAGPLMQ